MMAIHLIFMNKSCFISLFKIVLLPLQKYIIPGLQYEVNSITLPHINIFVLNLV